MSKLSDRIIAFNKNLLPEMVQLKYEALAENAFRFFRGTCHLFYEDLAAAQPLPLSPLSWISGACISKISAATRATISWFILT